MNSKNVDLEHKCCIKTSGDSIHATNTHACLRLLLHLQEQSPWWLVLAPARTTWPHINFQTLHFLGVLGAPRGTTLNTHGSSCSPDERSQSSLAGFALDLIYMKEDMYERCLPTELEAQQRTWSKRCFHSNVEAIHCVYELIHSSNGFSMKFA